MPTKRPVPGDAAARAPMPEVSIVSADYLHVKGADYEGVIAQTGGPWTPGPAEVAEIERVLGPALAAHAELGPSGPTSRWKRQYTGADEHGKQVVHVYLACHVDGWPADGIPVTKGGGTCYGYAIYDVATHSITMLQPNASE